MKGFRYILLVIALGFIIPGYGQVKFTGSVSRNISTGQRFELKYTVNGVGENFQPPVLGSFQVLSGPNQSTSQSFQMMGGKTTQSTTTAYSYVMVANKAGKFTIPPASITVAGKQYKSNPIQLSIAQGAAAQKSNGQQQGGRVQAERAKGDASQVSKDDLFLRMIVNKTKVSQGEHLIATLKVYTKLEMRGPYEPKFPALDGFWKEDIEMPGQLTPKRETLNGKQYQTYELKKYVLFPNKSGDLTIDPFGLTFVARVQAQGGGGRRSIFDNFFGRVKEIEMPLLSPPVKIKVLPHPGGKPANFTGAVGNFKLVSSIDKTETTTNEPITVKVKITGNGNIRLINELPVNFPADFEVYDPKITSPMKASTSGVNGSKNFEYLLIPRHSGTFRIPPLEFSYFDPSAKKYKTLSTEEYNIEVARGEGEEETVISQPGMFKENVKFLGEDIRYIKTGSFGLQEQGSYLFGSTKFYLGYGLSSLAFILFLTYARLKRKESENVVRVRNKQASKMAKKRLKKAEGFMKANDNAGFYKELVNAFWGYLGDKLNMPLAEMNKDSVKQSLLKREVPEETINSFLKFMDECEFAQFAPSSAEGGMSSVYANAVEEISKMDQFV